MNKFDEDFHIIYELDLFDEADEALVMLFDIADSAFWNGEFTEFSKIFNYFDSQYISTVLSIGILAATLPAKKKFEIKRNEFVEHLRFVLKNRGESEDRIYNLLKGLE